MCFCIQHLYALETKGLPQCVILTIDPFPVNETGTSNKRGCHKELQEVRNDIMSMGCYMPRMRDGRYIVGEMAQQGSRLRYQDNEQKICTSLWRYQSSPGIFTTIQNANYFDTKITKLNLLNHVDEDKIEDNHLLYLSISNQIN